MRLLGVMVDGRGNRLTVRVQHQRAVAYLESAKVLKPHAEEPMWDIVRSGERNAAKSDARRLVETGER